MTNKEILSRLYKDYTKKFLEIKTDLIKLLKFMPSSNQQFQLLCMSKPTDLSLYLI